MRKTLMSMTVAVLAALALLVPTQSASAAPAPCVFAPRTVPAQAGYSAGEKAQPFALPPRANHIALLDGFSHLPAPVIGQNLAETVAINTTASPAVARYAVDDNYAIGGPAIFNALGSRLSPAFFAALRAGQLPKTASLLTGDHSLLGKRTDTATEKKHFDNRRPFEVAPGLIRRYGDGRPDLYADVRGSGSYPSGHTTWGYTEAFLIAALVPEVGTQILARGAEYGYHRIVLGVHYPLDVIGGRIQAQAVAARALGDPRFARLLAAARTEIHTVLAARLGAPIGIVAGCQRPYVATAQALASYRQRLTYSFQPIGSTASPLRGPAGAVTLIRAAHPRLTDGQLRSVLAQTALPSGYPLDKTGPDGGWQRLDIARAWAARVTVHPGGGVTVAR